MTESVEQKRRRLRMAACRRGLLEAELALRPFVEAELAELDQDGLEQFERFLALEDLDLWELLCSRRPAHPEIDPELIRRIRKYLPS